MIDKLLDIPIAALEEYGFNVRYLNILENHTGAVYMRDLKHYTRSDLREISNVGHKLLEAFERAVVQYCKANDIQM